jgi:hypothetical protein
VGCEGNLDGGRGGRERANAQMVLYRVQRQRGGKSSEGAHVEGDTIKWTTGRKHLVQFECDVAIELRNSTATTQKRTSHVSFFVFDLN